MWVFKVLSSSSWVPQKGLGKELSFKCRLYVLKDICEQMTKPVVLFPAAHTGALRPVLRGGGGLLAVPGGDGASCGSQLHPHRLSQTQPPRPRQSGVCRVGKLLPDLPTQNSPDKCPDIIFFRTGSGPLGENESSCSQWSVHAKQSETKCTQKYVDIAYTFDHIVYSSTLWYTK